MTSSLPIDRYYQRMVFHRSVLAQSLCCVLPATAAIMLDNVELAAMIATFTLILLLGLQLLLRDAPMYSSILVSTVPMFMALRNVLPGTYSLPELLAVIGVVLWIAVRREEAQLLLARRFTVGLMAVATIYWLSSAIATGDYGANLRALELVFYALNLFLLSRDRAYLASTLLSLTVINGCFAIASFGRGERLGMMLIDGHMLGNPQAFGTLTALSLLATFADGGRWLSLVVHRPQLSWAIRLLAGAAVLLSTSRSAWIVCTAAIALIYVYDSRRRWEIVASVTALTLIGIALIAGGVGSNFEEYLKKTFGGEQSLDKITTGRSEQWEAIPAVVRDSPVWGVGPGFGQQASYQYAHLNLIWHSLYLQIVAELGLIGLAVLLLLLAILFARCMHYAKVTGEILPLVGAVGFAAIGFAVPGLDAASACFLGLSLISFDTSRWYILSERSNTRAARDFAASRG